MVTLIIYVLHTYICISSNKFPIPLLLLLEQGIQKERTQK